MLFVCTSTFCFAFLYCTLQNLAKTWWFGHESTCQWCEICWMGDGGKLLLACFLRSQIKDTCFFYWLLTYIPQFVMTMVCDSSFWEHLASRVIMFFYLMFGRFGVIFYYLSAMLMQDTCFIVWLVNRKCGHKANSECGFGCRVLQLQFLKTMNFQAWHSSTEDSEANLMLYSQCAILHLVLQAREGS